MIKPASSTNDKITLADIARASGVSPATVSLVLRDKPGVGPETRQRVRDVAQALGYITTPSMQTQNRAGVTNIGLVVKVRRDDLPEANSFYAPVLTGIELICRKNRVNLLYATMPVDEHNHPVQMPRLLAESHTEGLLLVGMHLDEAMIAALSQQAGPVVLVDAYAPGGLHDAVVIDNENGAYQATRYLIEHGHHHIAIVGSEPNAYPGIQERRAGYLRALAEYGLSPYFADCRLWPEAVPPVLTGLLQQHPHITALFGCNDSVAIAAMRVAQTLGRCIPKDLSIVGFDNITLAYHVSPSLTTMRVDKMGMGRLAAQTLLNRLEFPRAGQVHVVICPHLIERESVQALF